MASAADVCRSNVHQKNVWANNGGRKLVKNHRTTHINMRSIVRVSDDTDDHEVYEPLPSGAAYFKLRMTAEGLVISSKLPPIQFGRNIFTVRRHISHHFFDVLSHLYGLRIVKKEDDIPGVHVRVTLDEGVVLNDSTFGQFLSDTEHNILSIDNKAELRKYLIDEFMTRTYDHSYHENTLMAIQLFLAELPVQSCFYHDAGENGFHPTNRGAVKVFAKLATETSFLSHPQTMSNDENGTGRSCMCAVNAWKAIMELVSTEIGWADDSMIMGPSFLKNLAVSETERVNRVRACCSRLLAGAEIEFARRNHMKDVTPRVTDPQLKDQCVGLDLATAVKNCSEEIVHVFTMFGYAAKLYSVQYANSNRRGIAIVAGKCQTTFTPFTADELKSKLEELFPVMKMLFNCNGVYGYSITVKPSHGAAVGKRIAVQKQAVIPLDRTNIRRLALPTPTTIKARLSVEARAHYMTADGEVKYNQHLAMCYGVALGAKYMEVVRQKYPVQFKINDDEPNNMKYLANGDLRVLINYDDALIPGCGYPMLNSKQDIIQEMYTDAQSHADAMATMIRTISEDPAQVQGVDPVMYKFNAVIRTRRFNETVTALGVAKKQTYQDTYILPTRSINFGIEPFISIIKKNVGHGTSFEGMIINEYDTSETNPDFSALVCNSLNLEIGISPK